MNPFAFVAERLTRPSKIVLERLNNIEKIVSAIEEEFESAEDQARRGHR